MEGQSDERILRAGARVLDHPLRAFFSHAHVRSLLGRRAGARHPWAVAGWIALPAVAEEVEREFDERVLPGTELFASSINPLSVMGSTKFLMPLLEAVGPARARPTHT